MLPSLHDLVAFVPLGLAVGAVYGVSGVGIVVLYRTTGVLNFAYGAIGALGVFIAFELLNNTATSWCPNWLAYLACVLVGGAIMLAYGLVFGPVFAARDPLVKAAATLGLTLILLAIMSWVWPANEVRAVTLPSDGWHNFGYQVGDVRISWTKIIALLFAVGVTAWTSAFLRYTKLGTAYRAVANDREITATLGVPVRRVETSAWLDFRVRVRRVGAAALRAHQLARGGDADLSRHLVARGRADRTSAVAVGDALRGARDRGRRIVPAGVLPLAEREPTARAVPCDDAVRARDRRAPHPRASARADAFAGRALASWVSVAHHEECASRDSYRGRGDRTRSRRPCLRHRWTVRACALRRARADRRLLGEDPHGSRDLLGGGARVRASLRTGRDGLALPDRPARGRRAGRRRGSSMGRGFPSRSCSCSPGLRHGGDRDGGRAAGAAGIGPPSGADHAHVRRGDHARAQRRPLPERRRGLSGAGVARRAAGSFRVIRRPGIATSDPAYYRYTLVVAAIMFLLALWQISEQARPGVGRDPRERAGGARGRRQHHARTSCGRSRSRRS